MLKIKLSRFGKKNQPHYRIIIAEAKSKRDGRYVDKIGYYIPHTQPSTVQIDIKKYDAWIQKGAVPTSTVAHLRKKVTSNKPTELPKNKKAKTKKKDKNKTNIR